MRCEPLSTRSMIAAIRRRRGGVLASYAERWIGPFSDKEDCVQSQQAAILHEGGKSGFFLHEPSSEEEQGFAAGYYYTIYTPETYTLDDVLDSEDLTSTEAFEEEPPPLGEEELAAGEELADLDLPPELIDEEDLPPELIGEEELAAEEEFAENSEEIMRARGGDSRAKKKAVKKKKKAVKKKSKAIKKKV